MNFDFKECRCLSYSSELCEFIGPGEIYEYRYGLIVNKMIYTIICHKTREQQTISEEEFKTYFKPLENEA